MNITFKYGFLIILAFTLTHLLIHCTVGVESAVGKSIMLLNYAFYLLAILLGVVEKRKMQNGLITYREAFFTGFRIMAFAVIIISGYQYLYLKFINHQQVLITYNEQNSNNAFESILKEIQKTPLGISALNFMGRLLVACLISMIIAAFIKREPVAISSEIKE